MIIEISKKVTDCCVNNHIVSKDEREVYEYGMELLIATIVSTAAIIGLGMLLHRFLYTLLLLIPFYNIRIFAGGIHAETYTKCISSFTVGFLFILLLTEYVISAGFQDWILKGSIMSAFVICLISPVEDRSRPLSLSENAVYNRKTRHITIFYALLVYILYSFLHIDEAVYISMAINSVVLVLVLGIIKNRIIGFKPVNI